MRAGLRRLQEETEGDFVKQIYEGAIQPSALVDRFHMAVLEQLWNAMCREDAALSQIDGRILDDRVARFRDLDKQRIAFAALEIARKHHDKKPAGRVGEMAVVRAELNKSRKLLPVRKLVEKAGNAIQQLKPVFLMSPLSVAQYIAPGQLTFDLLLIDEASQVRPEDALGTLARAAQVVVVGDPKQLPPTNFFNRLVADADDVSDDEGYGDGAPPIGAMESILSLCDATFPNRTMLAWHYRSQHPALIAVSNRNFYDNRLLLPPSVFMGRAADGFLGVAFHKVRSGGYDRGRSATNVVEADVVAEAVCSFARKYPDKSLGVGTFSVAQRDVIRDRIDERRRSDPALEPFFASSREHSFFVKNLESIQGDERDTIFISVGYGRDRDGRLTQNFGPIGASGGERRLNVLISRARERCEVFSSITADDISVSNAEPGVVAFKEFLQFAEKGYFDVPRPTHRTFDSDFEESVADFLHRRDFRVHPQVGMAGFFVDLGVLHPSDEGRYMLGIECDGATYHSSRSARDRDRIRQEILESRGWRIHRIWSSDWFYRRPQQEQRLLDALDRAIRVTDESPPKKETGQDWRQGTIGSGPTEKSATEVATISSVPYSEANFTISAQGAPHRGAAPVHQRQ